MELDKKIFELWIGWALVSEIRKKDEEGLIDYNVCVRKFTLYKKKLPKLYKEKPSLKVGHD